MPRGAGTLGFAQYLPQDQNLYTRDQLEDRMCMALGGRVSEQLNFGRITTGAADDLDRVTKMAYGTVVSYGMGSMGPLSYRMPQEGDMAIGRVMTGVFSFFVFSIFFSRKPYSEDTAAQIDEEVMSMIRACYDRTTVMLEEKMEAIDALGLQTFFFLVFLVLKFLV